jgi:beta-glucanase (GH16 family)
MAAMLHTTHAEPPTKDGWKLVFEDNFDGGEKALDANWTFQNGPSGHILSSRWRDNAKLEDGLLKLVARKETRAGQDWTAASCWSKQTFKYGYFECRYRYAAATGTNNSFWIMTQGKPKQRFEIDINEGHYPNEVNMNLHNWSGKHWAKGGRWYFGPPEPAPTREDAGFQFLLEKPITTTRLRFVSPDGGMVRVMELRAFPPSQEGYPSVFPSKLEAQPDVPNLASQAKVEASSVLEPKYAPEKAIDGKLSIDSRWLSGRAKGPHHLTLTFAEPQEIGCIQLVSGWQDQKGWHGIVHEFHFEYWDGKAWQPVPGASQSGPATVHTVDDEHNLGKTFHTYALEWNEDELIYFFDGKEIRRQPQTICRGPAPVYLSLAIIRWGGAVTDAIDGASMDVDYVRVWQREDGNPPGGK